jgi:hypothetical protein
MLLEQRNILANQVDSKPPGFGRTIIATAHLSNQSNGTLEKIRSAWEVISGWGRWCDEELGDWPALKCCLQMLPEWMKESMKEEPEFEIENWLDDLHDRNWIWWSSSVVDEIIKIDISCDSLPISLWPLEFVIKKAGCKVLYRNKWVPNVDVKKCI